MFVKARFLGTLAVVLLAGILGRAVGAQTRHVLPLCFCGAIENAPVSATRTLDFEPAPNSSDPVAFHAEEVYYRDSQGRTRSEFHYPGRPVTIHIIDPVANIYLHWTLGDTVAFLSTTPPKPPIQHNPVKLAADAPVVEGVPTRYNRWMSGKDKAGKTYEAWYSPDLGMAVVTSTDEVGVGKSTYRFVHVKREEPDAALFRAQDGMTVEEAQKKTPPQPPPAPARMGYGTLTPSHAALPHPLHDDNFLEAQVRFHAAVPRRLYGVNFHMQTKLKIYDLSGKQFEASREEWVKSGLARQEDRAPGWHRVSASGPKERWVENEGLIPLRMMGLNDMAMRPAAAERRIRIYAQGYVGLEQRRVEGKDEACTAEYAGARICLDPQTGFVTSASVDDEMVVYGDWKPFNNSFYPASYKLYRGKRLQMEAVVQVSEDEIGDEALLARSNPEATVSPVNIVTLETGLHVLSTGEIDTSHYGEALVRVEVDTSGRVHHAEVLDADDKALGEAAVKAAKKNIYMPFEKDGTAQPFVTTFYAYHWSVIDPLRDPATSRASQGND